MKAPLLCQCRGFPVLVFLAVAGASVATVRAQPLSGGSFSIVGAPAAAGTMTGGPFRLTGYVASTGAETSSGENLNLTCGLIGVYVVNGPGTSLRVQLTPLGEARIWWAEDEVGYQLESSPALGALADWQPVSPAPVGNECLTPARGPARFFRLRRL